MDPYDFHDQEEAIADEDDLERLERELAPSSADYYGVLNISKKATEEEIKESYKKLCRFFHPDKHTDEEKKRKAESRFQVIQKAYEVLSDPKKRIIYDTYGEEGLNASWDVGPRYKTTEELREEYEKQAKQKREQELENLVRSRSDLQLTLDASQVFDPYEPPAFAGLGSMPAKRRHGPLKRISQTQVQQLFMRHSFQTQIGPQTVAVVGGSMLSRGGMGGGNLMGTIRHTVSPKLSGEGETTLLKPRLVSLKTYYSLSSDSFINTSAQCNSIYDPPILSITAGRRLYASTTGYLTYRTGEYSIFGWGGDVSRKMDKSSVALGMAGMNKSGNYSGELQTGVMASHIAGEYSYKLPHQGKLQVSCTLSTQGGISASVGSDHKVTKHARIGFTLECGLALGVIVKFRVSRLGQKVTVPIILSPEFDLKLVLFGAVVPATVAIAVDQWVLKPIRRQRIEEKVQQLREQHKEYLENRKREALDAQSLMEDIAKRKQRQEENNNGLVIVKAIYGNMNKESEQIDVTVVVQTLVHESRLTIPSGHSKTHILGFYDPCLGEKKQLMVEYRYRHRLHQVTVDDQSPLLCPMEGK
ncbi:DnaJ-domain-containing protein [Rhizopus microsporus ATCC 52813]|uniref:DnaJ-domain-containing protein n=1 Tax=Rhizopus microsporus ATCC 52813 TaxID=1340429 RepID=A0A2G4SMJ4_RHIZD|nr:DnaJ-domain-containing protein [Rhizopus microsporus ATCC 52813]PHZ09606.1 DnaJ-domain-containing protein [Rhizopus microsporus ATCC 52813]